MFVLEKERTFNWPIKVSLPQENGTAKVSTFTGKFKLLPREEYSAAYEAVFERDEEPSNDEVATFLEKFLIGWAADLVDEDNQPIEYSRENLLRVIHFNPVLTAILVAYNEALTPQAKKSRRQKN